MLTLECLQEFGRLGLDRLALYPLAFPQLMLRTSAYILLLSGLMYLAAPVAGEFIYFQF